MKKMITWTAILLVFVSLVTLADIVLEKQELRDSLIRLHVVGASDEDGDQKVKLQVRDAVISWLEREMDGIHSMAAAKEFLRTHLVELETVANRALEDAGVVDTAAVSFVEEAFPMRTYDTFALPSGVYQSLRICIGEAEGKNWWCVVFPSLCLGATTEEMHDTAASAGFEEDLTNTLTGEKGYEIRFFLLDCLGVLENFFFRG